MIRGSLKFVAVIVVAAVVGVGAATLAKAGETKIEPDAIETHVGYRKKIFVVRDEKRKVTCYVAENKNGTFMTAISCVADKNW